MTQDPPGAEGTVRLTVRAEVATLTVHRPHARNAMTMPMYRQLADHLEELSGSGEVRVVVMRGAGGSFIAGTDITHFTDFAGADDGLRYEESMERVVGALETLPVPTLAVVEGAAVGGGLILAAACDLRVCTPDARFGMPIARTVGHGLSVANYARLVAHLGPGRTKALLMLGGFLDPAEARAAGFVHQILEAPELEEGVAALCARVASHAPLTLATGKEAIRRVMERSRPGEDDDLLRTVYGSEDFRRGVRAFLERQPPRWEGR